jgi:hypothetical protein
MGFGGQHLHMQSIEMRSIYDEIAATTSGSHQVA